MGIRTASAGRVALDGHGHHRAGAPASGARPASATSPRTGTGTGCCWRPRCGRTGSSATRPQPPNARGPLIDRAGAAGRHPSGSSREYDVRTPGIDVAASALSGGNQQKLIVGREMSGDPRLLIAAHPTRGVDVGAQAAIWDQLRAARAAGLAVLLISADLDELIGLSDTLRVILRGRLVGRRRPGHGDAGGARLGDDRRRRRGRVRPREPAPAPRPGCGRPCSTLAAPVLALLFALVVTSVILLDQRARPGARRSSRCADYGTTESSLVNTINQAITYYLAARRGRDRLPDEPVQHRRRRPVPARRAARRGGRRRAAPAAGRCTIAVILLVAMVVGAAWAAHRRSAQGHPRGQRGHLDDHAELHRHRRDRLPADAGPAGGAGGGQQQHRHPADPGERPGARHSPISGADDGKLVRLDLPRGRSSASAYWFLLDRTRFGFDLRATGRSEPAAVASGVNVKRMIVIAMLHLRRGGRPGRHAGAARRGALLRHRLPDRARLHRHRDRAARPQQPGRHGVRRAAVGVPGHARG